MGKAYQGRTYVRPRSGYQPYSPANLMYLMPEEREEAASLANWYCNCRKHSYRVNQAKLDRLIDLNAKGAIVRNTDGPSWMEWLESYEGESE